MSRFWVGVANCDHVFKAVNGGFCQLNHGREAPVQKLKPGDQILYYSPRERMHEGTVLQAFTAAGEVIEGEVYRVDNEAGFRPYRRNVRYLKVGSASIRPLLPKLSLTKDNASWGQVFRRGCFEITAADHGLIVRAMRASSDGGRLAFGTGS